MGYTHDWDFTGKTDTKSFVSHMKKINKLVDLIVKRSNVKICYDWDFPFVPYQNEVYGIRFNGMPDEYCETFLFNLYDTSGFCKTNREPYDIIVTAVLYSMQSVFPKKQFHWGSDGRCEEVDQEIIDGYQLFCDSTNYTGPDSLLVI